MVRIASYNVENLFNRAKALDQRTWAAGRPILEAFQQVCELLEEPVYTDEVKHDILRELGRLGLRHGDTAKFARLRIASRSSSQSATVSGRTTKLIDSRRSGTERARGRRSWRSWSNVGTGRRPVLQPSVPIGVIIARSGR